MADTQEAASSGLFGVFLLSIYSLFLIPYTIYYLCSAGEEATTQPVAKGKKKQGFADRLKAWCTKSNLLLLAMWVTWFAVLFYTQSSMANMKPFDPFEILGVPRDASDREIKKAYRKLSLVYHPDKNPDPQAAQYFASFITKAYAALTDEVSRQNYEKYGHPDGPQGINLGVALPDWMFAKDKKAAPLMLLGLVGCGILLPLGIMSWYMLSSSKFTGPNQIMNDTYTMFMYSKYAIKESQSLVRIPETLLCAVEFISLYTPPEHNIPLDELRRLVAPYYPELMNKANKNFWQRKASVVKAHMLLLAHLERLGDEVPAALQSDLKYVLSKSPLLLEEMVKLATIPRTQAGTGWMTPALACVEMCQCIAQALPVSVRKGGGKGGDTLPPLLQLPGMTQEVLKKLRKRKINTLADLQALSDSDRAVELGWSGLDSAAVEGVNLFLSAMPRLVMVAKCEVDGEDEIMEGDPVHCRVRVMLTRPSHKQDGFMLRGSAVRAYTPYNPTPRDEAWYFFLTDVSNNAVLAWTKVNLMEAEKAGLAHPEAFRDTSSSLANGSTGTAVALLTGGGDGSKALVRSDDVNSTNISSKDSSDDSDPLGQEVDLMFMAPKTATHSLSLVAMSDCWVGVDETVPIKLRVAPLTRAVAEGRLITKKPVFSDTEDEDESGSGSGSGSDSDDDEDDYDSEETGEEESGEADDDSSDGDDSSDSDVPSLVEEPR